MTPIQLLLRDKTKQTKTKLETHFCVLNYASSVDALTPYATVFGDTAFEEVLKVKQGHKGGS